MSSDELFSRQEALAGFPAKRASTLLFLIENRTAHLAARSLTKERVDLRINSSLLLDYEGMFSNADINSIEFPPKNNDHQNNKQNKLYNLKASLFNQRRFLIGIIPLVIVFILTEWLFFARSQSFTNVLAFAGVLSNSLVGGIFPILRYAICQLPIKGKQELKIWAHRRNISRNYENLPTLLEVYRGDQKMQFDLSLSGGKVLLPAMTSDCWLKFQF